MMTLMMILMMILMMKKMRNEKSEKVEKRTPTNHQKIFLQTKDVKKLSKNLLMLRFLKNS